MLLQKVVELDSSRISARLKLAKKHSLASSKIKQLQLAFRSRITADSSSEVFERIDGLLNLYHTAKLGAKNSSTPTKHELLKQIVTVSHDLARSKEFNTMLESLGTTCKNTAELSDIIFKLGQYYRATCQLVQAARRKRCRIFRKIKVQTFRSRYRNVSRSTLPWKHPAL